jgi:glycosyl transferase family 9 (putative heptosyltransferase)
LENTCSKLLSYCLRGEPWPDALLDQALAVDDGKALLSVVVERLGDVFEPKLVEVYNRLFAEVIRRVCTELAARIRSGLATPPAPPDAKRVYVLSRVTLGADVAVTSVLLDAAKQRYPDAEIIFAGPRKSYELFESDPRVRHIHVPYARGGGLRERLLASGSLWIDDGIVLDPDSRLTQLGVLSVCQERNYFHFPSRGFGGDSNMRLPVLAGRWAREVFGVENARPYIAPLANASEPVGITVSLGVGENLEKRVAGDFEKELLRVLAETGETVLVDKGGSADEHARVERALVPGMLTHQGEFAPFAARVAKSKLFVGYDSAGGHVASACGVPLVSIAKGFVSERMAARWRPLGTVISGDAPDLLEQVTAVVQRLCHNRR